MKKSSFAIRGAWAILSLISASLLLGASEGGREESVDWQRMKLESELTTRISQALQRVVTENRFLVTLTVELKPEAQAAPNAGQNSAQANQDRIALGKLNLDLPLATLDLVDKKAVQTTVFDRIQMIRTLVVLDQDVTADQEKTAKEVLDTTLQGYGKNRYELRVQKGALAASVAAARQQQLEQEKKNQQTALQTAKEQWDTKRWISELKLPLVIVMSTLLICLFGFLTFRNHQRLESRRVALLESQNQRAETEFQRVQEAQQQAMTLGSAATAPGAGAPGSDEAVDSTEAQDGFERFRTLLRETPEKAAALVKQWAQAPVAGASEALTVIPQVLDSKELEALFKYLSPSDRREWRRSLLTRFGKKEFGVAGKYMASQIAENLIAPTPAVDPSIRQAVADLKFSECVELARRDAEAAACMVVLLPSAQVVRVFSALPSELATAIMSESLRLSDDQIQAGSQRLGRLIEELKSGRKSKPFAERAVELVRGIKAEKEGSFFRALAEAGEFEMLKTAARQSFPSELILRLPAQVLKVALDALPLSRRAEVIASRSDDERQILLASIGGEGSKAREVINIEIQEILADAVRVKRLERNRDAIWQSLTQTVRGLIQNNVMASEAAEDLLDPWFAELGAGGAEVQTMGGGNGFPRAA